MENTLVDMMSGFIDLNDEEKQGIREAFPIKSFKKNTLLLKEGQVATNAFVVIKGCIREFSILNGEERTTEFYTEFQSAVNFDSMANKTKSKYFFACTEESVVAIMNAVKENALYKKFPHFGEICRVQMEKILGANQEAFSIFKTASPKERYLTLLQNRPNLVQRVPLYQLASYLGIKPETLSRIRKKISIND